MKKLVALAVLLFMGVSALTHAADCVIKKKNGQPVKISCIGKTLNDP